MKKQKKAKRRNPKIAEYYYGLGELTISKNGKSARFVSVAWPDIVMQFRIEAIDIKMDVEVT